MESGKYFSYKSELDASDLYMPDEAILSFWEKNDKMVKWQNKTTLHNFFGVLFKI
jgi:hypothetical protein